jgi:hypothetical protein
LIIDNLTANRFFPRDKLVFLGSFSNFRIPETPDSRRARPAFFISKQKGVTRTLILEFTTAP